VIDYKLFKLLDYSSKEDVSVFFHRNIALKRRFVEFFLEGDKEI